MAMTGWVAFYLEALGFSNTAAAILILVTGGYPTEKRLRYCRT